MKRKGWKTILLTIRPSIRKKGEETLSPFRIGDWKKKKEKRKERSGTIYTTLGGGNTSRWRIFVCPGSSCTDSSRVRGREAQRTMDEKGVERGGGGKEKAHGGRICIRQSNLGLLYLIGCPQACLPLPRQSTSPYFSSTLLFASLLHLIAVFLPPLPSPLFLFFIIISCLPLLLTFLSSVVCN